MTGSPAAPVAVRSSSTLGASVGISVGGADGRTAAADGEPLTPCQNGAVLTLHALVWRGACGERATSTHGALFVCLFLRADSVVWLVSAACDWARRTK
jgi:hypothetical protein